MKNLRFHAKFGWVFAVVFLGLMLLGGLHIQSRNADITRLEQQLAALPPWKPLLEVVRLMQQSRGLSAKWINGDTAILPSLQAKMAEVDRAWAHLDTALAALP